MALACVLEMGSVSGILLSENVIFDVIVVCWVPMLMLTFM